MLSAALLVVLVFPAGGHAAEQRTNADCTIFGTAGPDVLVGTAAGDVICSLGGDDVIHGRGGKDVVYSGDGRDKVFGEDGPDRLHGGGSGDLLAGAAAGDRLYGESGGDRMRGGPRADLLFGDGGNDNMNAGGDDGDHAIGGAGVNTGDTLLGGGYHPDCPSQLDRDQTCVLAMHLSSPLCLPSNSYTSTIGSCTGRSWGNSAVFSSVARAQYGTTAGFAWVRNNRGVNINYQVLTIAVPSAFIIGDGPTNPGSPVFNVFDAFALFWSSPSTHFQTESRPDRRPSDDGGALYLNFESGRIGADIHFWGFMRKK